jgi:hypothetical protein
VKRDPRGMLQGLILGIQVFPVLIGANYLPSSPSKSKTWREDRS